MYPMSSSENQDKGFGENCLNQVCGMIRTVKKGKTCEIALTSFALAHSLLAGQKIKISLTNRKSCSFKKAPL